MEIKYGIPQGSILGPLLFTIFLNDMFYFLKEASIASYADDTTLYATDQNLEKLLETLLNETSILLEWFRINEMKSNTDKCHLLVTCPAYTYVKLENDLILNEPSVNLLGITIEGDLKFNEHVKKLCKKGNQKLHALARISKYIDKEKLRILMKAFVTSQFNYCSLIWIFHSRTLNNKMNKLHERALRIVYPDQNLSFDELLELDNSMTIHDRNLHRLATEMYKVKNNISPVPVCDIFKENNRQYDLRTRRTWEIEKTRTVLYGSETVRYQGPKIWDIIPDNIKNSSSPQEFKSKLKTWKPEDCACRLCKTFIPELGFID